MQCITDSYAAGNKNTQYFLLQLDPSAQTVAVMGYRKTELERASNEYLEAERWIVRPNVMDISRWNCTSPPSIPLGDHSTG